MPHVQHVAYVEFGSGRPFLFLPCPGLSNLYWRPVMDHLPAGVHSILIDPRGHGQSGLGDRPWTFGDIVADLAMVVDALKLDRPIIVGYSAGASIGLQAVLDDPDRYGGLVMVSGFSECSTPYLRVKLKVGLAAISAGLHELVATSIVATNAADSAHRRMLQLDVHRLHATALRSYLREVLRFDVTERLPTVRVPVLLVHGSVDGPMHTYYRKLRAGLADATAVFYQGNDHRIPTRCPKRFAALIAHFGDKRPTAVPSTLWSPYVPPNVQVPPPPS